MIMSETWDKLELSLGDLTLDILPGIGGRLWDIKYKTHSVVFQNPDLIGKDFNLENLKSLPTRSPQFAFPLWGGEKTWIAPDKEWKNGSPYPMLDSGPYKILKKNFNSIKLASNICPITKLEVEREISLSNENTFKIFHRLRNCGKSVVNAGIWSVLMLRHGCKIGLHAQTSQKHTNVFGNCEGFIKRDSDCVVFDCSRQQEFKVGITNQTGLAFFHSKFDKKSIWLTCQTEPSLSQEAYSHGHNFEVFNSYDYPYCEAEWHSGTRAISPKESITFSQTFQICDRFELLQEPKYNSEIFSCMS